MDEEFESKKRKVLRSILTNTDAIWFFQYLVNKAGTFNLGYIPKSNQAYFLNGRASIGREILTDIANVNPKAFAEIASSGLIENLKRRSSADEQR